MNDKPSYRDDPDHFGATADSVQPGPGIDKPQDKATTNRRVAESPDWKDGVGPLGDDSPLKNESHAGDEGQE